MATKPLVLTGLSAGVKGRIDDAKVANQETLDTLLEEIDGLTSDMQKGRKAGMSARAIAALGDQRGRLKIQAKEQAKAGFVNQLKANNESVVDEQLIPLMGNIVKNIGKMIKTPITEEVMGALRFVHRQIEASEKKTDQKIKSILKNNKEWSLEQTNEEIINLERNLASVASLQKIDATISKLKVGSGTSVPSNPDYPFADKRKALAGQCVASAKEELNNYHDFEGEADMFACFVGDCMRHYALGYELLKGDPRKIDAASNMDTASRENLSDAVWSFCNEKLDYKRIGSAKKAKR